MQVNSAALAALPEKVRPKLYRLIEDRESDYDRVHAVSDRSREAFSEYGRLENAIEYKISQFPSGRVYQDELTRLREPLIQAAAARDRARDAYDRAGEAIARHNFLPRAIDWLHDAVLKNRSKLIRIVSAEASLKRGQTHTDAVSELRAEIEAIMAKASDLESAPATAAETRQRITEALDGIAARGAPSVDPRIRIGDPAKLAGNLQISINGSGSLIGDGGSKFIVWLLRAEIENRLHAMADAASSKGVSDDDREAGFAELAQRRLELERLEEAHIWQAAQGGIHIPRRADADPRAILEVDEE